LCGIQVLGLRKVAMDSLLSSTVCVLEDRKTRMKKEDT